MDRSLRAVLLGTFTLRFSTGLTGSMLAFYLAHLHEHGGPEVDGAVVGLYAALFYLAELVLSPLFGILSDRIGHHRVMLYGPVFGAVAVLLTAVTTNLVLLGGTRILEGASGAASVPSILGFIAMATAGNEVLRGQDLGPLRGGHPGRPGRRRHRRGQAVRDRRAGGVPLQRGAVRRLVPHLPVRRVRSGGREGGRGRRARAA